MPSMHRIFCGLFVLLIALSAVVENPMAQSEVVPYSIRGDLLNIKGDIYIVRDIHGRLVYLRIDKNTTKERLVLPGEKIEADVLPGGRVIAVRPAN